MKSFPQRHLGLTFRSRTEARWAECFWLADVLYEYEPEGFQLEGGDAYLPDFWLVAGRLFFEVKPYRSNDREDRVAMKLAITSGCPVVVGWGGPSKLTALVMTKPSDGLQRPVRLMSDDSGRGAWIVGDGVAIPLTAGATRPTNSLHPALEKAAALQFNHRPVSTRPMASEALRNSKLVKDWKGPF